MAAARQAFTAEARRASNALDAPPPHRYNLGVIDSVPDPGRGGAAAGVRGGYGGGGGSHAMDSGFAPKSDDFTLKPKGQQIKKRYLLPKILFDELHPHQQEALDWFWNIHCSGKGGIVADDMGTGKTRQVCAFLKGLLHSELIKRALIIIPGQLQKQWVKTLIKVDLGKEINLFRDPHPQKRIQCLENVNMNGGLLITTYDLASRHWETLNIGWDYLILDESHYIKNPRTKRYQHLDKIIAPHRILLTGTPAPNSLKDLYHLFNFCSPGLFKNEREFTVNFLRPLMKGNFKGSSNNQLIESYEASRELKNLIKPYFLRRMKDSLTLPEKTEVTIWLKLSDFQEELYRTLLSKKIVNTRNKGEVFVAIKLMEKICNHPNKLMKTTDELEDDFGENEKVHLKAMVRKLKQHGSKCVNNLCQSSCKIEAILKLLKIFGESHKVLIFSQTCEMLDVVEESIKCEGFTFYRIDGTMSHSDRQNVIDAFKLASGRQIFLISARVGGTGLDLPEATRTIIVDPDWTPSNDDQISDRSYRFGQQNNVVIYRLIASETVEEYVYKTQLFKAGSFKAVTQEKTLKRYVAAKMAKDLFKLPSGGFGSSRTQQLLEKKTMRGNLPREVDRELKLLDKEDIAGLTIHSNLFLETVKLPAAKTAESHTRKGAARQSQNAGLSHAKNRSAFPLKASDEPEPVRLWSWDVDPVEEAKKTRLREITNLERTIKSKEHTLKAFKNKLPDQGNKLKKQIEEYKAELARLKLEDSKDHT